MKLRSMLLTIIGLLLFGSIAVNASETPVPTLISVSPTLEVRGEYLSYIEGQLEVKTDTETLVIKVNHDKEVAENPYLKGNTFGSQLSNLPAGTLLDMVLLESELGFSLVEIQDVHLRMDSEEPMLINEPTLSNENFNGFDVMFGDQMINFDTQPQVVNGKVMVPLRFVAEALGYEVVWNAETKSVDLIKGPQFTSVTIQQNAYFRNKMAPSPLSTAPVIVGNRTLIPIEFITEILGYGVEFKEGVLKIYDEPFTTLTGYISEIVVGEKWDMVTVAPRLGDDVEMWETTILIVNADTIINRNPLAVGDLINGVHLPMMTMSIPGQTSAVVIY